MIELDLVSEEIRELARLAIELLGADAAAYAGMRAEALRQSGDADAAAVWLAAKTEIERLQALEPEGGTH